MTPFRCRSLLVPIAVLGLAGAGRAEESPSPIRDEAHLFPAAAVAKAEKQIEEIQSTYHHSLVIETIPSLPPSESRWLRVFPRPPIGTRMKKEAQRRAEKEGLHGVFVLLCAKPKEAAAWTTDARFFPTSNAVELQKKMARRLQDGQAEGALEDAVSYVRATLQENRADQWSQADNEWFLAGALGAGVGLWVLVGLLRRRLGPRGAGESLDLQPALLAGRFGSPAGFWIYDRVFLAHRAAVPPGALPGAGASGSPPPGAPVSPAEPSADVAADEEDPLALQEGP
jgi:hypothetical protein